MITITITIQEDAGGPVSIESSARGQNETRQEARTARFLSGIFTAALGTIQKMAPHSVLLDGPEAGKLAPAMLEQMRNRMKGGAQ